MSHIDQAVRKHLEGGGTAPAILFGDNRYDWNWLGRVARFIDTALVQAGIDPLAPIALVARNRPGHVAALASQLASRRTTCMVYSAQSPRALAANLADLAAPAIIADAQDWSEEAVAAAARAGAIGIVLSTDPAAPIALHPALSRPGAGPFRPSTPDIAVEMLTSGTTGAPKRVPLAWRTIEQATREATRLYVGIDQNDAPQLMLHALGNISGISFLGPALARGQTVCLLEKFAVEPWVRAIEQHGVARSSLPPAALRMVLEADVPKERIAGLEIVAIGGGRIEPRHRDAFEARYGIPVLVAYGATEFGGVIANWPLDLYREYGLSRRESVGRATAGVALRIVSAETGAELPAGEIGLLEARVDRIGPDWIRTTDHASLDEDGFLFLHGRADGAIERGGFKILPETVAAELRRHPAIADAAVIGLPDRRLGQVPVAAVELEPGAARPDEQDLIAFLREGLLAYQLPAAIRIVDALPRNTSMKVAMNEVRAIFETEQ